MFGVSSRSEGGGAPATAKHYKGLNFFTLIHLANFVNPTPFNKRCGVKR